MDPRYEAGFLVTLADQPLRGENAAWIGGRADCSAGGAQASA